MSLPGKPELKPNFRCMTDNGRAKTITNVPEGFFKLEEFQSGKTLVSVFASGMGKRISDLDSDVVSRHDVIDMTAGSGMIVTDISSSKAKSSFARNSDFNLAVIRVSDSSNHSPDDDVDQISNNIFGTGGAPLNLVRDMFFNFSFTLWFVLLKYFFCTLSLIISRDALCYYRSLGIRRAQVIKLTLVQRLVLHFQVV